MVSLLRKMAVTGLVWLTAGMTLAAGMPRLACARGVRPGQTPPAASPAACACACGGGCCCRSHSCPTGQSTAPSIKRAVTDNHIPGVPAVGRSGCRTMLMQGAPVAAAMAKTADSNDAVPVGLVSGLEACLSSAPLSRTIGLQSQSLPTPDLITTLQHFTI